MNFLWENDIHPTRFPQFKGELSTDVLVIGGGMAGVLCAHALAKANVDYALVEAKMIGCGITKGTTAVLSAQHDILYTDLIKARGREIAKRYLNANLDAVQQFKMLAENQSISCDFEQTPSIMYSVNDGTSMQKEAQAVKSLGFPAEYITDIPLPISILGAVRYPNMAQFHPLKFLQGIAKDLNIYEHSFVHRLEGMVAITDTGTIRAKKIIVATHFPMINSHGLYFMKLHQQRSFVLALENAPTLDCTLVDAAQKGMYFRNYQNLLLIGGGDHRTGRKKGGFDAVRAFAKQYFPEAKEVRAWANQDCMSLDGVPYIGRYSPSLEVYVATGFNEWGMTSSMVASNVLCDLVQGRENPNAAVFSPSRSILHTQLFANLGATLLDFAIPTTKRCSHLGCALRWNPAEHSWDCPCHGSRFDEHGALIDNPAMKRAKV